MVYAKGSVERGVEVFAEMAAPEMVRKTVVCGAAAAAAVSSNDWDL